MDDTALKIEPIRARRDPVVIGTGLVALDVVIPSSLEDGPQFRAGGTCGNVLTALSFLGWCSYPIARLSKNGASKQISEDLSHWGVNLDFVTFDEDGSTPVVIQQIRNNKTGEPVQSFSRKCPVCGGFLPWYKPVRVADVNNLVPSLPKPQVFFFDRTSAGAIALAKQAFDDGAIVFFEPSTSSDPNHLEEALKISHIVKVSTDRIGGNEAVLTSKKPLVVIETQGSTGLRFRYIGAMRGAAVTKWLKMPALYVDSVRDSAGAGDWCTAGIIYMLGAMGAKGLEKLTLDEIRHAIQVGQAMASWTCGFDGPRGGMYITKKDGFEKAVQNLLHGKKKISVNRTPTKISPSRRKAFACESCLVGSQYLSK